MRNTSILILTLLFCCASAQVLVAAPDAATVLADPENPGTILIRWKPDPSNAGASRYDIYSTNDWPLTIGETLRKRFIVGPPPDGDGELIDLGPEYGYGYQWRDTVDSPTGKRFFAVVGEEKRYPIVDTGQDLCYDATVQIDPPEAGEPFFGQDAQYDGNQPSYLDNGDGTVTDLVTGLMWQRTPDLDNKSTFPEAVAGADTFGLAGYTDWRLPSIKELYSLIDFRGSTYYLIPYVDTTYFDFRFGDESIGERVIDAQYWSSTEYVGTTMSNDPTVFGVNFADGRIKGYPRDSGPGGDPMTEFVRYVRGNPNYGINDLTDNGDSTITDLATGLTWAKYDSDSELNWEDALAYSENLVLAGYDDWRLPNPKELQSIVDYTRAPDAQDPAQQAPAIDPIFEISDPESWCWTGTTHLDGPGQDWAVYVCFGLALGYMGPPGMGQWLNVHGAGAQRSDPKSGDPANWPYGHGPQGDQVRIYNHVRCVRGG